MKNLIEIARTQIGTDSVNAVDSRVLYKELGLATGQYPRWIKANLVDLFEENEDYMGVRHDVGGNSVLSYIVTLDVAKHLCMMARTKNAMEFRKYFIEVEKQSQKPLTIAEQISLIAKGHAEVSDRLLKLEATKRLEAWQEKALHDAKNKKVYALGGMDIELVRKLHRKVWAVFKKHYNLPRYNELPSVKFDEALAYIQGITISDLL